MSKRAFQASAELNFFSMHAEGGESVDDGLASAAISGNLDKAVAALAAGASLTRRGAGGATALDYAAINGNLDVVKAIWEALTSFGLDKGEYERSDGWALTWAAKNGHAKVVEFLAGMGKGLESADKFGRTPLLLAFARGEAETARVLLKAGADSGACDASDMGILETAARYGGFETMVEALNGFSSKNDLAKAFYWVLWDSKEARRIEKADFLLASGLDPNARQKGNTLLADAVAHDDSACARRLLECGAEMDDMLLAKSKEMEAVLLEGKLRQGLTNMKRNLARRKI